MKKYIDFISDSNKAIYHLTMSRKREVHTLDSDDEPQSPSLLESPVVEHFSESTLQLFSDDEDLLEPYDSRPADEVSTDEDIPCGQGSYHPEESEEEEEEEEAPVAMLFQEDEATEWTASMATPLAGNRWDPNQPLSTDELPATPRPMKTYIDF